jgi:hypothetical protein
MAMAGSSALARVAVNPACEIQVAMARSSFPEPEFFRRATGDAYDREFGERLAARRRGSKFEQELFRNNAIKLCEALGEITGADPRGMFVRNFDDELPGGNERTRIARYSRMKRVMGDLAAGAQVPDLLIHPQFLLHVKGSSKGYFWIEPDFAWLDANCGMYVPGDLKSFVVEENDVDPGDLVRARLQIGAQILALRELAAAAKIADRVGSRGMLIFATPFGLSPHRPRIEDLAGAIHSIEGAIAAFEHHGARIDVLRAADGADMHMLVPDLASHFQERCVGGCVMAEHCRLRHAGTAVELGDAAARLLGADTQLDELVAELNRAAAGEVMPSGLASELVELATSLGVWARAA